jgi:hypothetical protein
LRGKKSQNFPLVGVKNRNSERGKNRKFFPHIYKGVFSADILNKKIKIFPIIFKNAL